MEMDHAEVMQSQANDGWKRIMLIRLIIKLNTEGNINLVIRIERHRIDMETVKMLDPRKITLNKRIRKCHDMDPRKSWKGLKFQEFEASGSNFLGSKVWTRKRDKGKAKHSVTH